MTTQETVRRHIQQHPACEHLRELSFGCEVERTEHNQRYFVITDKGFGNNDKKFWVASVVFGSMGVDPNYTEEHDRTRFTDQIGEEWRLIGHPPELNDYLAVLGRETDYNLNPTIADDGNVKVTTYYGKELSFNLKTGEPATEEDWKTYAELVGIKLN